MKEIRDIKIDLLMGNQNPIIERFREITKDLCIIKCDVYNEDGMEFIYFNQEREWIFYQDAKNGKFWTNYYRYWSILEREFRLEYLEIQSITKLLVEEALKREVAKPHINVWTPTKMVEEALMREVAKPPGRPRCQLTQVEEVLKREVADPLSIAFSQKVGEVLKREVAAPTSGVFGDIAMVEEVLKREVSKPTTLKYSGFLEEAMKREVGRPIENDDRELFNLK
jgi:hypothetical protein